MYLVSFFFDDWLIVGFQHEFAWVAHIADFGGVGNESRIGFSAIDATLARVSAWVDILLWVAPFGSILLEMTVG